MEGMTSCMNDMLDSMKAAQVKLESDTYSVEDFLKKDDIIVKPPTVRRKRRKLHMCNLCGRSFSDASNLRRHNHIHTDSRPFGCHLCNSSFRQKAQLDRHQLVHTGERPFQCTVCKKGFRDSTELKVHLRVHTGERPYSCPVCHKNFSRICYMRRHQETHVNEKIPIIRKPEKRIIIVSPNEIHEPPVDYQCPYCVDWFLTKKELEDHRLVHLKQGPGGKKIYECVDCKKRFNHSSNLRKHAIIHTGLKPFSCNLCKQSFRQATHLQRHYLVHTGKKPFKCTICLKGFRDASDLLKHQRVHGGNNPNQSLVPENSITDLHSAEPLNEHVKQEIISEDHPLPSLSDNVSNAEVDPKTKRLLAKRLKKRQADESEEIFKCSICSRVFNRVSNLHRHYLMHTGYRPYSCHTCSKTFQQMAHLIRHRRVHNKDQRYKCTTCHNVFKTSNELLCHQEDHSNGKLFSCHKCNKTYTQIHFLESHQKSHERDISMDINESNSIEVVV